MREVNVSFIGMPGAGKSTVGKILALRTRRVFVDTDNLLVSALGMSLQAYLDKHGFMALRKREHDLILSSDFEGSVVSTGGSVVYSDRAMAHLKQKGVCVYISCSLSEIALRVGNFATRGLACESGTSLEQLFEERRPLYEKYADVTVCSDGKTPDQVAQAVLDLTSTTE